MNLNTIGADGNPIFSLPNLENNISFLNLSVIIGENSGSGIDVNSLYQNELNTFLGQNSGELILNSYLNTFIGANAGDKINQGSNNIIIGKTSGEINSYDIISIGSNNVTSYNSISVGNNIHNNGVENCIFGKNNNFQGHNNICTGNDNTFWTNNSIIFGNDNGIDGFGIDTSNIVIIGNGNLNSSNEDYTKLLESQPVLIGNELIQNTGFVVNIRDTFIKYDDYLENEIVFIGLNRKYESSSTAIGFDDSDIESSNLFQSSNTNIDLFVKHGIQSSHLTLTNKFITIDEYLDSSNSSNTSSNITSNISSKSITLSIPDNLTSNIQYILPNFSYDNHNMFLSVDDEGVMNWKKVDVQISSTDDIPVGSNNLYFNDEIFNNKLNSISLDDIQNGVNNTYIKNGIYNKDLVVFGTLTVNKLRVLGVNMTQDATFDDYINNIVNAKVIEWETTISNSVSILDNKIDTVAENLTNYVDNITNNTRWFLETTESSTILNISKIGFQINFYNNEMQNRTFNVSLTKNDTLQLSFCIIVNYFDTTVYSIAYQLMYANKYAGQITKFQTNIIHGIKTDGNSISFYSNMIDITLAHGYSITIMSI
jgi:hypothetical protein